MNVPETRYADTSRGRIAYQVVGDGPLDLVGLLPMVCPIDLMWDEPTVVRFLDRLSSFSRDIWFDPRGRGASDPLPHVEDRFAEASADDMLAMVDHLGCEQVAVIGLMTGPTILFAASHPERTKALVLYNTSACFRQADGYPEGVPADLVQGWLTTQRRDWGTGANVDRLGPSAAGDARLRRWLARCERLMCTADEAFWRHKANFEVDLRPVLSSIQVPTLVLYRRGNPMAGQARYVAEHITGAKRVELPGDDYLFFVGDTGPMLDAIEEFLTGRFPVRHTDRVLATVLFTDIVGSTERAARLGDRRWRDLLATHDTLVRADVDRFRGRVVKSTGDGVLATFDGPGRAIRCAGAIRDSVRSLGIDIRAGLHTGEVEVVGDDVAGMAVHIGARVSSLAGAGEVLVSSTVKDLVAGSGIEFDERGEHQLKGVPDQWRLYAVVA
jgi:class 3 adenylate cyclase/pimeloyl-ACP methyl ester carboxylesterase